jgi:ribonuclease J
LRDRKILASEGVVIAVIKFDVAKKCVLNDLEIISRGFVFEKAKKGFLKDTARRLVQSLNKKQIKDNHVLKLKAVTFLEDYFAKSPGRRPMVLPVVIEV